MRDGAGDEVGGTVGCCWAIFDRQCPVLQKEV
jgi:hypothetical protein